MADKPQAKKESKKATKSDRKSRRVRAPRFIRAIGSYFVGSWRELRQTTWPTRRAALGLTLAVIVFTAVMMGFMVVIDYAFDLLFKQLVL